MQKISFKTTKNIGYLTISAVVSSFAGFLVAILFTRLSTKEIYGQYNYILSIVAFLSLFSLPGVATSLINSIAKNCEGDFIEGTKRRLKYSLLGAFVIMGLSIRHWWKGESGVGVALLIVSLVFLFYSSLSHIDSFYVGKKDYKAVLRIRITVSFLILLSVAISLVLYQKLFFIILLSLGTVAIFYLIISMRIWVNLTNRERDQKFLSFAKNMTILSIMGSAVGTLDRFIVGTFFNYDILAIYSIGFIVHSQLKKGAGILSNIVQPSLVNRSVRDSFRLCNTTIKILLPLVAIGFLLLYLVLPYIIPLFFTKAYSDSIFYARLFLLPTFFGIPGWFYETIMRSHQLSRKLYYNRIIGSTLALATLILGGYYLGVSGIILSRIVNAASVSFFGFLMLQNSKVVKEEKTYGN